MMFMKKAIIYFTNNILDEKIFNVVLKQLKKASNGIDIVSVSHKPMDLGKNIVVDLPSCAESIFKQIYIGLNNTDADVVYLAEHDVLYHPCHFETIPTRKRYYLYNTNVWQVDNDGQSIYRRSRRTSQLIVHREILKDYLEQLFNVIDQRGYNPKMGVSPMTHQINEIKNQGLRQFKSDAPNIDIRHDNNFSNYAYEDRDIISDEVPGWGKTLGRFNEFLDEI